MHENTIMMKRSCIEETSCELLVLLSLYPGLSMLLSHLIDVLDAALIETRRDDAQSRDNTADCKDASYDG